MGELRIQQLKYRVENKNIYYHLDIKTSFENGDENFGGNNLTYRISQFLKIVLASNYEEGKKVDINELIDYTVVCCIR